MRNPLWKQPGLGRIVGVTIASVCMFILQIVMSHVSHSLTLLVAAYHMLYNILSLSGCIATIKMCQRGPSVSNTFGWARLEVLSMVTNLLFLFALDFSLVVEAVQTLIHYDHMDPMHQPGFICIAAGLGILLNIVCVLLIGGYTHHQGSFLALTPGGDVIVQHGAATENAVRRGLRRLVPSERVQPTDEITQDTSLPDVSEAMIKTKSKANNHRHSQRWPTIRSLVRDNASSLIALISALVVYFMGEESFVSFVIDPVLTVVSVTILAVTSYPFMIQAGQILLQTTPDHIDVAELKSKLLGAFPSVVNVHDLHVWALTPDKVISTAHLVFMNENVYLTLKEPIHNFFIEQGITRVTLQPEFYKFGNMTPAQSKRCVLTCSEEKCKSRTCCNYQPATEDAPAEDIESSATDHHHCCSKSSNEEATQLTVGQTETDTCVQPKKNHSHSRCSHSISHGTEHCSSDQSEEQKPAASKAKEHVDETSSSSSGSETKLTCPD